ncbi:MAG TPA: DNA alkylation repair protein, partial [Candidatus Limnocylindria bacterium]|nr:DNA alkylation repair protein [Candidatus Limnocylindria bacterium]
RTPCSSLRVAPLPLVTACLRDEREYVQKAVGWVLREMGHAYPEAVNAYIKEHTATMSPVALRRARGG